MRGGLGGCLFYEYEGMKGHELWEVREDGGCWYIPVVDNEVRIRF